eukprot:3052104-Amphidinium_carterae.1
MRNPDIAPRPIVIKFHRVRRLQRLWYQLFKIGQYLRTFPETLRKGLSKHYKTLEDKKETLAACWRDHCFVDCNQLSQAEWNCRDSRIRGCMRVCPRWRGWRQKRLKLRPPRPCS